MTKALMDWKNLTLTVDGHANWSRKGSDIVCAGESMLVCALAGALEEATQRGRTSSRIEMDEGKANISADPLMECSQEIKGYFRMCVTGMRMLSREYPEYIKIQEVG